MGSPILFVHIPKTAGTFVLMILGELGLSNLRHNHVTFCPAPDGLGVYGVIDEAEAATRTSFTVLRNPFDLLVSHFFHGTGTQGWMHSRASIKEGSFEAFVRCYAANDPKWIDPQFQRFMFFQVFGADGRCKVDHVIRSERLLEGLEIVLGKTGNLRGTRLDEVVAQTKARAKKMQDQPVEIFVENRSPHRERDYRRYYNRETRELIADKCRRELAAFGYDFDGPTDDSPLIDCSRVRYSPEDDSFSIRRR